MFGISNEYFLISDMKSICTSVPNYAFVNHVFVGYDSGISQPLWKFYGGISSFFNKLCIP